METATAISPFSDEELMQGILACEQPAFDRLYDRYRLLLRKVIGQVLFAEADVDETLQDVFLEIWKRAGSFDASRGKPLGWIICMARRRAIDRHRRVRRLAEIAGSFRDMAEAGEEVLPSDANAAAQGGDLAASRDLDRALTDLIGGLPGEQQSVIRMTYYQRMSQRQIAKSTGVALGTIKTRLELALRKLSKRSDHLRADLF